MSEAKNIRPAKISRDKIIIITMTFLMISGAFPFSTLAHHTQFPEMIQGPAIMEHERPLDRPKLSMNQTRFIWWNANWHYRRAYNITGTGNLSIPVNFTALLTSLQVTNKTMENSTVTIVQYHQNGSVVGIVNTYDFKENSSFHNDTNACGLLTWRVTAPSIYCVYFDVKKNKGQRSHLNETSNLSASGDARINFSGSVEGWQAEFSQQLASYYLPNQQVNITVNTTAKAGIVTARFYRNGTYNFSRNFHTLDTLHWKCQTFFSKRGNWTMKINASDDAGYHAAVLNASFFIGNPDLALTKLAINSPPYYRGKTLVIQAHVWCSNATLSPVNVSLYINNNLTAFTDALLFQKNKNTTVNFTWTPSKKKSDSISVVIDKKNIIPESNENNNNRTMVILVQGIPELGVVDITVPSLPVNEGNPATMFTKIINRGDENATNYRVNLYLEQTNTNSATLTEEKNYTYVSIAMNQTVNVTLVWNPVRYGNTTYNGWWVVGIKILSNESKPDSNTANNTKIRYDKRLKVLPGERNPPVITILIAPQAQEQRLPAEFLVEVTDDTGVGNVTISIKNPNNIFYNRTMTPLANNQYRFILVNTSNLGRYYYSITAVDTAFNKTKKTVKGFFDIVPDMTPPTISFYDAYPFVQLKNNTVEIRCIASDVSGIMEADVVIVFPDNHTESHPLTNASNDTKYVYTGRFNQIGRYEYTITVVDTLHNMNITTPKDFWITMDLNDSDSDSMPDSWEKKYGFNPYDPSDATQDADNDSVTNLEEYKAGSNPLIKESSTSDFLQKLMDNWVTILGVLITCAIIFGLVFYRERRKK